MDEKELEGIHDCSTDPGYQNVRADIRVDDCCWGSVFGDRMAPCAVCQWGGLCPEYYDELGNRSTGS